MNKNEAMNNAEYYIMKHFSDLKIPGFAKVLGAGLTLNKPYIAQELLGKSVFDYLKARGGMTLKCSLNLGIKVLDLLESLHSQGFVHCDLKPENILVGDPNKGFRQLKKLYLIDFGLSHSYLEADGSHRANSESKFKGNIVYGSKFAFENNFQSRRDDIVSLIYMIGTFVDHKQPYYSAA